MPLGSVDTLSDDGAPSPEVTSKEDTTSKPKAVAKPPKVDKATPKSKAKATPKAKAKQTVLKRPAGSSSGAMKRPAAATKDPDRVTASKGLYKNGTWGLKLNGKQVLLVTWLQFFT